MPTIYPKNILGTGATGTPVSILGGSGAGADANAWHVCYTLVAPFPGFHEIVTLTSELGVYWLEITGWIQSGTFVDRVGICSLVTRNSIERVGLNHETESLLLTIQNGSAKVLVPQQSGDVTYSLRIAYRHFTKPKPTVTFASLAGKEVVPVA